MEEIQVQRRLERARQADYTIRNLGDHPIFSRFVVQSTSGRTYEVTIRSLFERANSCTCPDFLTNLVGTCKHVEAVLLQVRPENASEEGVRPVRPQVYLHHGEELEVRLLWTPHPFSGGIDLKPLLERYFRLDGTFRGDLAQEFEGFREAALRTGEIDIASEVLSTVKELRERALHTAELEQWQRRLASGEHLGVTSLPLYPFQESGALHLAFRGRAMLADEMGLGKTVQAIAAAELLRREGRVRQTLVVCPPSMGHHWHREIFRFAGQEAVVLDRGSDPERSVIGQEGTYLIVTYEQVVGHLADLSARRFDLIILDDAQRIRNWRGRAAEAVKRLGSRFAFVLIGTSLENRLDDLYSVVQFLDQKLLGPLWRFNQRYYVLEGGDKVVGVKNLDDLRSRLGRVVLRRRRSEVARQLPDRVANVFEVEMDEVQMRIYDEARAVVSRVLAKGRSPSPPERSRLVRSLEQMRQACNAAVLVEASTTGPIAKLAELERLLQELQEKTDFKLVICSEWDSMLNLAGGVLSRLSIEHLTVSGATSPDEQQQAIDRFRTDPRLGALLWADSAKGDAELRGVTSLINLDVPWSGVTSQRRESRVRPPGQDVIVHVIQLVSRGTIEEALLGLHDRGVSPYDSRVEKERSADRMPLPVQAGKLDLEILKAMVDREPATAVLAHVPGPEARTLLQEFESLLSPKESLAPVSSGTRREKDPRNPQRGSPRNRSIDTRKSPDTASVVHPGRGADRLSSDPVERLQVLRRVLSEAFGTTFKELIPLGSGFLLKVDRMESRTQVQASGISARTGVPILVVDSASLKALEQIVRPLAGQGPLDAGRRVQDSPIQRARLWCEKARARLAEARCLVAGGMGPAALKAARDAMLLSVEGLSLIKTGSCPSPADLMGELYGRLVRDGEVPLDVAAGVSRANDLAAVAEGPGHRLVDPTIARAVLRDAERLLSRVEEKLEPGRGEASSPDSERET